MAPTTQQLFEDALRLPEGERADLASRLIDSLMPETDDGVGAAWEAEISGRIADLDQGRVKPIPWGDARRMIVGQADESPR